MQSLKQARDQLKAEMDLTPFLDWFDAQIVLHKQAIARWPHERETFSRLIRQCELAKQTMISQQQALKLRLQLQLHHQGGGK